METLEDIKWVDTHCHLQLMGDEINEEDISNLEYFIIPGVDVPSSLKAKELSITYPEKSYWSAGLHPHEADSLEDIKNELQVLMEEADLIGETGLDYYYDASSKEQQRQSFIHHLQAADVLNMPTIVHTRDAREDTIALIDAHGGSAAGVLHCFTESLEMAQQAIELGYLISISGIVTFKNSKALQDVVRALPLEKLLVETDSPYLAPVPYRGGQNLPKYVVEVAQCVADIKGVSLDKVAEVTTDNYHRLFGRAADQ